MTYRLLVLDDSPNIAQENLGCAIPLCLYSFARWTGQPYCEFELRWLFKSSARSALRAVGADTLLRFLNRLGRKTFFDTPIRNQPDQCSDRKDALREPSKMQRCNDC